jgi:predicted nucleic acid-binding protein
MAGSTLDDVPGGQRIFIDATVFVYHFTRASEQCRRLLERCERRDLLGVTSVVALAEATHRLMMIEAVADGRIEPGTVARKLAERPDLVRACRRYNLAAPLIAGSGIEVLPLDLGKCLRAADVRIAEGLLTNDSLLVATIRDEGIEAIASADSDFLRVSGLKVYRPTDLQTGARALA